MWWLSELDAGVQTKSNLNVLKHPAKSGVFYLLNTQSIEVLSKPFG